MHRWRTALLCALALLISSLTITAAPAAEETGVRGPVTVPVTNRGGEVWIDVKLNDRVTSRMMVDTGSSVVILPARIAAALGLDVRGRRQELRTIRGPVMGRWVTLEKVGLGPVQVEAVSAIVLEDENEDTVGLLGRSFLNHFSYSVDLDRGVLTLSPRKSGASVGWRAITPEDHLDDQLRRLNGELARASTDSRTSSNYLIQLQRSVDALEARRAQYR